MIGISENIPVTSEDFQTLPKNNVWGCSNHLWKLPKLYKTWHFWCCGNLSIRLSFLLLFFLGIVLWIHSGHKVNTKCLFGIYLCETKFNFHYWSCVKEKFIPICESGVRNCPWFMTSMSVVHRHEAHNVWELAGILIPPHPTPVRCVPAIAW